MGFDKSHYDIYVEGNESKKDQNPYLERGNLPPRCEDSVALVQGCKFTCEIETPEEDRQVQSEMSVHKVGKKGIFQQMKKIVTPMDKDNI